VKEAQKSLDLFFPLPKNSMRPAEDHVVETLRMCFAAFPTQDENGKLDVGYKLNTTKLQLDLSHLDVEDIRFDKAAVDCHLLGSAIKEHPGKIKEIAGLLLSGERPSREKLDHAFRVLTKLNLTEESASAHGGGPIWMVIVAVVVIIAIAARSCNPNDHDVHGNEGEEDEEGEEGE
jgi:hypothetical protein